MSSLLCVHELSVSFVEGNGLRPVLDQVSFEIHKRGSVALVGESGSGKSLLGLSLLRLLPDNARITSGTITYADQPLLEMPEAKLSRLRGNELCLVFQEPSTALDPYCRVKDWLLQPIKIHHGAPRLQWRERARQVLQQVGIALPDQKLDKYPHELSQGDQKRLLLAAALTCNPKLLILDEPLAGLDPTSQAQLLDTLQRLQVNLGLALLIITHDLSLVDEAAQFVVVLYAGQVVEEGNRNDVLSHPCHPYTRGLLASSLPDDIVGPPAARRLPTIAGAQEQASVTSGCRFRLRCAYRLSEPPNFELCDTHMPELITIKPGQRSRCHFAKDLA